MKKLLFLLTALLTLQGLSAQTTDTSNAETAPAETTATAEASTPAETTVPAQATAPATPKPDEIKRGYHTYYYQGKTMTDDELENFLRNTCPEAYRSYKIGSNMRKGGIISLSVGAPVMVGGLVMLAIGIGSNNYGLMVGGGSAATVGSLACDAGIALTIVGTIRRNRAYKGFNEHCAGNPLTLSLQTGSEGVGLALTF